MVFDIVFPSSNESDFIVKAQELGYDSIIFVYDSISEVPSIKFNFPVRIGVLCESNKIMSVKSKGYLSVLDLLNSSFESLSNFSEIDILLNLTSTGRKKYTHIRNSGMNQVVAKSLHDNNILVAECLKFDVVDLFSDFLGRLNQNFTLSKKYDFRMSVFSFAKSPLEMSFSADVCSLVSLFGIVKNKYIHNVSFDYF
ncbi:hypothetical protein JXM83_06230 [Candidatus Woesearchaeota archaeon]|nr:hypothetical protein [Candidatus Woesearchaeota archaeon]